MALFLLKNFTFYDFIASILHFGPPRGLISTGVSRTTFTLIFVPGQSIAEPRAEPRASAWTSGANDDCPSARRDGQG